MITAIAARTSIGRSLFLIALLASVGCQRKTPKSAPGFSKGILGVWVIDTDRSVSAWTEIPHGLSQEFPSLDAYRQWARPKIDGAEFDIYPNGKAFLRLKDKTVVPMRWEQQGDAYWVGNSYAFNFSVGHIFRLQQNSSAICKFQMDYSESVAPRSPLFMRKVWE